VRARIKATDPRTFQLISGRPQLVEFFSFDNPTSRSMAPVVHALEDRYGEQIGFVYLDLDDPANSLYKSMLKGRIAPFFYLIDGQGVLIQEWQGRVPAEAFESAFAGLGR
jgi:thiol-disulfide isomerase/thioredoxin